MESQANRGTISAGPSIPRAKPPTLKSTAQAAQVAPITPRPGLFPQVSTPATGR